MTAEPKRVELTDAERVAVFDALAKINNPAGATALLYAVERIKAAALLEALEEAEARQPFRVAEANRVRAEKAEATIARVEALAEKWDRPSMVGIASGIRAALAEPERDEEGGR